MKTLLHICMAIALAASGSVATLVAQQPKSRDQLVQEDLTNFGSLDTWIYNDVDKGFETARATGKPLLVVFRCIPCEACAQLDLQIVERDPLIQSLLDQYVCVRVVQANGMDLGLFQFDYDQSFAAFIMNGDKTIYGRYGTRSHQTRSEEDVSLDSFAEALEAGLQVQAAYPANKNDLAGKQSQSLPPHSTPEEFPRLQRYGSKLDYQGKVAATCIHCHQVGESLRDVFRDQKKPIPMEVLFPYPHPKALGLILDPEHKSTVARVEANTPAEQSGLKALDEILAVDGQPILSIADIQWVLHRASPQDTLSISIRRGGMPRDLTLQLPQGWRSRGDISWRATSWALRRMTTGGMLLEDMPDEMRAQRNIDNDSLALVATHVGEYGEHALAKRRGFIKGDVIVSIAGESKRMRESDLFAFLVNRPVGEEFAVTVLRGLERIELGLATQK